MGAALGAGLAMIVGVFVVICLIASFFLKLAANWISKLDISFGKASRLTLITCWAGSLIAIFGFCVSEVDSSNSLLVTLVKCVALFLMNSWIFSTELKVKYGIACLMVIIVGLLTSSVVFVLGIMIIGAGASGGSYPTGW